MLKIQDPYKYRNDLLRQYIYLGLGVSLGIAPLYYIIGNTPLAITLNFFSAVMLFLLLAVRNTESYIRNSRIFMTAITLLFASGFINSNQEINSTFFLLLFPIASFSIRGPKEGIYWALCMLGVFILLYLYEPGRYNVYSFIFFTIAYLMVGYLLYFYRFFEMKNFEQIHSIQNKKDQLLLQQSKMAAMGEMIGVIAHQWKQPLSVISLFMQIIRDEVTEKEINRQEILDLTKKTDTQILHMSDTVTDFKNFLKPSSKKVLFQACELAQEVYKLNEAKFKELGITFKLHEHTCFEFYGLPNELKQVMMNIYGNACDVFEEREIIYRNINVYVEHTENLATIKIRDNGGGIPKELLPDKLFENYVSTKGEKGTGIGLQISRTIIEDKYNGKLWAHNVEEGAEFVIELPLQRPETIS